jgi:hypothetical protein
MPNGGAKLEKKKYNLKLKWGKFHPDKRKKVCGHDTTNTGREGENHSAI